MPWWERGGGRYHEGEIRGQPFQLKFETSDPKIGTLGKNKTVRDPHRECWSVVIAAALVGTPPVHKAVAGGEKIGETGIHPRNARHETASEPRRARSKGGLPSDFLERYHFWDV